MKSLTLGLRRQMPVLSHFLVLFSLVYFQQLAFSQRDTLRERYNIQYHELQFFSDIGEPAFDPALKLSVIPQNQDSYYFVQCNAPITREMKSRLTDMGVELFDYVPNNAFIVKMSASEKSAVERLQFVQFVGPYHPGYKIAASLQNAISGELELEPPSQAPGVKPELTLPGRRSDSLMLSISVFKGENTARISDAIRAAGGVIQQTASVGSGAQLAVWVPANRVVQLAGISGIRRMELRPLFQFHNDAARGVMHVDPVQTGLGLTGSNQIVGISDSGLDSGVNDASMHDDIQGNIAQIYSWPVQAGSGALNTGADDGAADLDSGHGTHTAGSIVADGTMSAGLHAGVAPDAQLVFQAIEQWGNFSGTTNDGYYLIGIPFDLNNLFQQAYEAGARIHSNSWGASVAGAYTLNSESLDEFVWNHPDMLILFSAGNSGRDADGNGVVDQGSMGSPGTAKNCLTVGASENDRPGIVSTYSNSYTHIGLNRDQVANDPGGIAAFSSRGPASGNRIKPDVVAPGTMVASTRSQASPLTILYQDDMESGTAGWTSSGSWARTTADSHSPNNCWHDSPGGNYGNNTNITLTSPVTDLSGTSLLSRTLHFWCRYELGTGDRWELVVSGSIGSSAAIPVTGVQTDWELFSIGLGPWSHDANLSFSLRLVSNNDGNNGDGLYIDDVFISEGPFLTALLSDYGLQPVGSVIDNQYLLSNGTSMSTPLTAGLAALVREYYTENLGLDYVSAALLRATIINGAVDLTPGQYGAGATQEISGQPDNVQGWGLADAQSILMPALPAVLGHIDELGGLETGETREYTYTVSNTSVPLSVTMVYHDYPGNGIQNNLNLTLISPSSVVLYPNGLTSADNNNNVERIEIPTPEFGDYIIRVHGQNVPQGPQPFAIATKGAGTIFERPPVDVMLVLDLSGSMLSPACPTCDPKLSVLKDAVEIFAQLWSAVAVDGDEMGVTYFKTNVYNYAPGGDLLPPFNAPGVIADVNSQTTTWTDLTAMGGGLQRGINTLTDPASPRSIILFTDGMQNVNPMALSGAPLKIDNDPGITVSSGISPTSPPTQLNTGLGIHVNTIGVGATPAFTTLLNDIATATGGVFKQTNAPDEDLRRFYVEQLIDVLRDYSPQLIAYKKGQIAVVQGNSMASEQFAVNKNAIKLLFKVSWKRGDSMKIAISKNGMDLTGKARMIRGDFYRIYIFTLGDIQQSLGGSWKVDIYGEPGTRFEIAGIAEEPQIDYQFSLGKRAFKTGETLSMEAQVRIEGQPVIDNAMVKATILKPNAGIGTLLAKYSLPNTPPVTTSGGQYEPNASIGQQKLQVLSQQSEFFQLLQKSESATVNLVHTGNGVYKGTFNDTWTPGAYTVVFYLEGFHPQLDTYIRTEQVTADFEFGKASLSASRVLAQEVLLDGAVKGYLISFRPKDMKGNFLGPDYKSRISVSAGGADRSQALRDIGDGSYELKIAADKNTPINISVLGDELFNGPIAKIIQGRGLYLSFHAGYPLRKDSTTIRGQFLVEGDLEYRFHPRLGVQLIGGYYLFDDDNSALGGSIQLKGFATQGAWLVYGEAGPGYYKPSGRDGAFAVNAGLGVMKAINPNFSVSAGGNYFRLFYPADDFSFFGIKAGVHYKF